MILEQFSLTGAGARRRTWPARWCSLASDAANYVQGHTLAVDGGWLGR
jgi:NAD(P)-dependent dehydrogenase (short-subunit alcohol dehydrogenase family)